MRRRRRGGSRRRRRRIRRPGLEEAPLGRLVIGRDHEADVGPAAAQAPAPQRSGFEADQKRDQDADGELHRAGHAERPERGLERRRSPTR